MALPTLKIQASRRGLERVVVQTERSDPADAGLALLQRVLPALAALDRQARRDG
jgi:hypothetical protein